jgi:hypothetical protein
MSSDRMIIIVLLALGWLVLSKTFHWFRSRFLLEQWARSNGFELLKMSIPWFKSTPFYTSNRQEVYQIIVRDHSGQERSGWARCGGFWLGFLANEVEVKWGSKLKVKRKKQSSAVRKSVKERVGKILALICKWAVIVAVMLSYLIISWWAKHPSRHS